MDKGGWSAQDLAVQGAWDFGLSGRDGMGQESRKRDSGPANVHYVGVHMDKINNL